MRVLVVSKSLCGCGYVFYIYIYIYIYQSKVFGHPQKCLFVILKVLFLAKQIKHHNDFIYYTKYKPSGDTLNTKKHKNPFVTSFGHNHCFTDFYHFFH